MAAPKNECVPLFGTGDVLTCHAEAAVVGKRFVGVTGVIQGGIGVSEDITGGNIQVGAAGAAERNLGVAGNDAAAGEKVRVLRGHVVLPINMFGSDHCRR